MPHSKEFTDIISYLQNNEFSIDVQRRIICSITEALVMHDIDECQMKEYLIKGWYISTKL